MNSELISTSDFATSRLILAKVFFFCVIPVRIQATLRYLSRVLMNGTMPWSKLLSLLSSKIKDEASLRKAVISLSSTKPVADYTWCMFTLRFLKLSQSFEIFAIMMTDCQ